MDLIKVWAEEPMLGLNGGLFWFKIACAAKYPIQPPAFRFATNGRIMISFSPF